MRIDLDCHCDGDAAAVVVFGHEVPLSRAGADGAWRGLIGIDLDVRPGTYSLKASVRRDGRPPLVAARPLAVVAKRFPVRRLRVAPRFVNPPDELVPRILEEARRLEHLFQAVTTPRQWEGAFRVPSSGASSGVFGSRSEFNGQSRSPHAGVDFRTGVGEPVASPAAGLVALAEPLYFTGNTVIVDHGLGLYSLLAHLSRLDVAAGDHVSAGEVVGLTGATGRVTGPHLHWSVRLNGARVDPLSVIAVTAGDGGGTGGGRGGV